MISPRSGKRKDHSGCLAFILHAHLPYIRQAEGGPALEEHWLYEALTETYIPLLMMMDRLVRDGIDFRLTFSLTPPLTAMLGDELLRTRYVGRLDSIIDLARAEIRRTRSDQRLLALARRYLRTFVGVRDAYIRLYDKDVTAQFKRFQDLGRIEIIASAATHAYLPLLSHHPSAVRAQIVYGIEDYVKNFMKRPSGFWLPECAYFAGLHEILGQHGIRHTVLETHGVTRARPRPLHGVSAPIYSPSGTAFFGRDPASSKQVWSATEGYPGDFDYREFYRDIGHSLPLEYVRPFIHHEGIRCDTGIKYFRVTGKTELKEYYVPGKAALKAALHASHFLLKTREAIEMLVPVMERTPLIVAPFDAELFGHWWYEGPIWIENVLRKTAGRQKAVRLVTLSEYLDEYPVNQVAVPSPSSWGNKGYHETWHNPRNDWIYRHLHHAALCVERLAARFPMATGLKRRALNQAARELLLAQASDWAFILNAGTVVEYARKRTERHLLHLLSLKDAIETNRIDRKWLAALEAEHAIFPGIDYRVFAPQEHDLRLSNTVSPPSARSGIRRI